MKLSRSWSMCPIMHVLLVSALRLVYVQHSVHMYFAKRNNNPNNITMLSLLTNQNHYAHMHFARA